MVEHGVRSPRDVVEASKIKLGGVLSNQMQLDIIAGRLDKITCEGPFRPDVFCDSGFMVYDSVALGFNDAVDLGFCGSRVV